MAFELRKTHLLLAANTVQFNKTLLYLCLVFLDVAGNSLSPLWRRIVVYPPDSESLLSILSARYQNLGPVAEKLIGKSLLHIHPFTCYLY